MPSKDYLKDYSMRLHPSKCAETCARGMVAKDTADDRGNASGHLDNTPQAHMGRSPPARGIRPGLSVRVPSVRVHYRSASQWSTSVASAVYDAAMENLAGCACARIFPLDFK